MKLAWRSAYIGYVDLVPFTPWLQAAGFWAPWFGMPLPLLLVILGGVSVMAKMRMSALQDTIETVGRDRLPTMRALGEINLGLARVRSASYRIALTATPEQREKLEAIGYLNK